jgi:MOSC domain-containing protein
MATLARISVTPIKGTALQHPGAVDLTPLGIPGNRRFHLVDTRGRLFSGGDHGPLVQVQAVFDPGAETLLVAFPGGTVITADAARLAAAHTTDFYGRPVPGRYVEGPLAAAFSAYVGRDVRLVRDDVEGDGPDDHRLTLMSGASVRNLGSRSGRPDLDARRFRMNLELGGCEPFEEDTWEGRLVCAGEAVLRIWGQVPRCVVTTQDPATGLRDFDTLKRIAEFRPPIREPRGIPFGMYAEVEQPGRLAVDDMVSPLPD